MSLTRRELRDQENVPGEFRLLGKIFKGMPGYKQLIERRLMENGFLHTHPNPTGSHTIKRGQP